MAACRKCGLALLGGDRFCTHCGTPVPASGGSRPASAGAVPSPSPTPPGSTRPVSALRRRALDAAVAEFRTLLAAVREGRLSPEDFRRRAVYSGIVFDADGAWILNLAEGAWYRYDGIGLAKVPGAETP